MKKYPHGLTLNAVCAAIEDYQRHEDSLPEEGILAAFNTLLGHSDIADELRIKQNHIRLRDTYIEELEQRAEAAEAIAADVEEILSLLAEREWAEHCTKTDTGKRLEEAITELHDEAAPAVSLTEMVPEGWKLVPFEPTEEMIAAGDQFMDGLSRLGDAYEAMLAAAPEVE